MSVHLRWVAVPAAVALCSLALPAQPLQPGTTAPKAPAIGPAARQSPRQNADLWVLKPVVRPPVPSAVTQSANPIDAFIAAQYKTKGLRPAAPADKLTLLRRVYLDLIGIPPTLRPIGEAPT